MGKQLRIIGSILILAAVVGWVVLSYLPAGTVALPQLHFAPRWPGQVFPALVTGGFALLIGLQLWLVQSTAASLRRHRGQAGGLQNGSFTLSVGREVILTALPIALIVLLAVMS